MTKSELASLTRWLVEPLPDDVARSIDRLRTADDVMHIALMPDVHLATDVCVGTVMVTQQLVYPNAVGGDIGCGMAAMAFDANAKAIDKPQAASQILKLLYERVPANKHRRPVDLPACMRGGLLTDERLQKRADRDGRVQLGTLGRGNHFLEFQADQLGRLWVMVHSGSRAMGQAIMAHHLRQATVGSSGLQWLDTEEESGKAYMADVQWARTYAAQNRLAMLAAVEQLLVDEFRITADVDTIIHCDHNHVQQEFHAGRSLWVHRKGAQSAAKGEQGVVPGSMGAVSFHTTGRGAAESFQSCSHGAGRQLSRSRARHKVTRKAFAQQVGRLWYDQSRTSKLVDEAPAAYKDIRAVMRAQKDLARIERELRPVLNYKGV